MINSRYSHKFLSSRKKKSSKAKKTRKNNSYSILMNYSGNSKIFISNSDIKSSKNKKRRNPHKKINIIKNNNSINNSKYLSSNNNINPFIDEKYFNSEMNSTFIYAGDNCSIYNNSRAFNNYLNPEQKNSDLIISNKSSFQENSFTLDSSGNFINSLIKSIKEDKNKLNKKLMEMMKKNNNMKPKEDYNANLMKHCNSINHKNNKEKLMLEKPRKIKKNRSCFIIFIVLNLFIYVFLFSKMFEPRVNKLFFDNDHDDYVYKTGLLSQDTCLTVNK